MNMVIPNAGKLLWLLWALQTSSEALEDFKLRLYQNDLTPDADTLTGDFDEASFMGYAELDILRADFDDAVIVADVAQSTYTTVPSWTCTGGSPQLVYGWYLVGDTSGETLAAQMFAVARNMTTGATEALDPFTISLQGI